MYDALVNDPVLIYQGFMLAAVLDIFKTIAVHLLGQVVDQLDQALVVGCLGDDVVKGHIRLGNFFHILCLDGKLESVAGFFQGN